MNAIRQTLFAAALSAVAGVAMAATPRQPGQAGRIGAEGDPSCDRASRQERKACGSGSGRNDAGRQVRPPGADVAPFPRPVAPRHGHMKPAPQGNPAGYAFCVCTAGSSATLAGNLL